MERNIDLELLAARLPHIAKALTLLWGEPEVVTYINKLFMDTRGGTRRGFPVDVSKALVAIRERHQHFAPAMAHLNQTASNHWGRGGRRERW